MRNIVLRKIATNTYEGYACAWELASHSGCMVQDIGNDVNTEKTTVGFLLGGMAISHAESDPRVLPRSGMTCEARLKNACFTCHAPWLVLNRNGHRAGVGEIARVIDDGQQYSILAVG